MNAGRCTLSRTPPYRSKNRFWRPPMNTSANPIFVECEVKTIDRSWQHAGIRFKGNSSLSSAWRQGVWKMPCIYPRPLRGCLS
jgi:hypothetical protein